MKRLAAVALVPVFIYSCHEGPLTDELPEPVQARVSFSGTVAGEPFDVSQSGHSRAFDGSWEEGDMIGVYMTAHGTLPGGGSELASNKSFMSQGTESFRFTTQNHIIYFPPQGKVDFYTYYPYRGSQNGYDYNIYVGEQSSQKDLDLMYASNTDGFDDNARAVPLSFTHQLTKLVINVSVKTDMVSVSGMSAVLETPARRALFSLTDGTLSAYSDPGAVTLRTTASGKRATVEAILLPGDYGGKTVTFTLPSQSGNTFTWTVSGQNGNWEPGHKYVYNLTLDDGGSEVEFNYNWVELPTITSERNTVFITHFDVDIPGLRNYSLLYDTENMLAYWVAYPMHQRYCGNAGRTDEWGYDPQVAQHLQPNLTRAWPNASSLQFDRGHQIPSADRTYSYNGNVQTFYFTNMTAQNSTLNQDMWADLEGKVRVWMNQCDTLYVVTGAGITTPSDPNVRYTRDNSNKQVAVPKYYYKALAKRQGTGSNATYNTIGFMFDNSAYVKEQGYINFSVSVEELERLTGYEFFPSIPEASKRTYDTSLWR